MTELLALLSSPLVAALIPVIPGLTTSLIGIFHKQGKITTDEVASYLAAQWLDPDSVFHKPAGTVTIPLGTVTNGGAVPLGTK